MPDIWHVIESDYILCLPRTQLIRNKPKASNEHVEEHHHIVPAHDKIEQVCSSHFHRVPVKANKVRSYTNCSPKPLKQVKRERENLCAAAS